MMLNQKRAVVAECLGLDLALDELAEARTAIVTRAAPLCLGATE